jgi:hypothetical protein
LPDAADVVAEAAILAVRVWVDTNAIAANLASRAPRWNAVSASTLSSCNADGIAGAAVVRVVEPVDADVAAPNLAHGTTGGHALGIRTELALGASVVAEPTVVRIIEPVDTLPGAHAPNLARNGAVESRTDPSLAGLVARARIAAHPAVQIVDGNVRAEPVAVLLPRCRAWNGGTDAPAALFGRQTFGVAHSAIAVVRSRVDAQPVAQLPRRAAARTADATQTRVPQGAAIAARSTIERVRTQRDALAVAAGLARAAGGSTRAVDTDAGGAAAVSARAAVRRVGLEVDARWTTQHQGATTAAGNAAAGGADFVGATDVSARSTIGAVGSRVGALPIADLLIGQTRNGAPTVCAHPAGATRDAAPAAVSGVFENLGARSVTQRLGRATHAIAALAPEALLGAGTPVATGAAILLVGGDVDAGRSALREARHAARHTSTRLAQQSALTRVAAGAAVGGITPDVGAAAIRAASARRHAGALTGGTRFQSRAGRSAGATIRETGLGVDADAVAVGFPIDAALSANATLAGLHGRARGAASAAVGAVAPGVHALPIAPKRSGRARLRVDVDHAAVGDADEAVGARRIVWCATEVDGGP